MYNEQRTIAETLQFLLDQTRPFDEIVVVNNNSTDSSADIVSAIAAEHPTVRLITETAPGVYAASATGFDTASGDIIARTDADTFVSRTWCATIVDFLDSEQGQAYAAVTGVFSGFHDGPQFDFINRYAFRTPKKLRDGAPIRGLRGGNMALRASAWKAVRDNTLRRQDTWDDVDIAMAFEEHDPGLCIWYHPRMTVETSVRAMRRSPWQGRQYMTGGIRTAWARRNKSAIAVMLLNFPFQVINFTSMWLVYRPWENTTKTWKLRRLFQPLDNGGHVLATVVRD